MMENVNFRNLSKSGQDELLERLPLFSPIETTEAQVTDGGVDDESGRKLARLLGAF